MEEIYLDNCATTKPFDEVIEIMLKYYKEEFGNPSSLHRKGINAENGIKYARGQIASMLSVEKNEIYFTSGGTESNNLAIKGVVERNNRFGKHIITSTIEHPSVLQVFKELENKGYNVSYLEVDKNGIINLNKLKELMTKETIMVSIMKVNNEIGTIQPIEDISNIIKNINPKCILHVDGVQAFGKIPCSPKVEGIDLFTISAHKIHGPKGIGAIYINKAIKIFPQVKGGGQERDLRSGTENVPGIVGFGKAVEITKSNFDKLILNLRKSRNLVKNKISTSIADCIINGPKEDYKTSPHILSVSFKDIKGEVLLHSLENSGIYISTGSACSSNKKNSNYVLKNISLDNKYITGTIRISFSDFNTEEQLNYFTDNLYNNVKMLRKIIGRK